MKRMIMYGKPPDANSHFPFLYYQDEMETMKKTKLNADILLTQLSLTIT